MKNTGARPKERQKKRSQTKDRVKFNKSRNQEG